MAPGLAEELEACEVRRQAAQRQLQAALEQAHLDLERRRAAHQERRTALERQLAALVQEAAASEAAYAQQVQQLQGELEKLEPACREVQLEVLRQNLQAATAAVAQGAPIALPLILSGEGDIEEAWFTVSVILPLPHHLAQLWSQPPDLSGTLALAAAAAFGEVAAALDPAPVEYDCRPCAGALLMELVVPRAAVPDPQVLVEVLAEELFRRLIEAGRRAHRVTGSRDSQARAGGPERPDPVALDDVLELVPAEPALLAQLEGRQR